MRTQELLVLCSFGALVLASACTKKEEPAAAPPPAAPVEPAPSAQPQILGKWCLRAITNGKLAALDGATWDFRPDGTYRIEDETLFGGNWKLEQGKLTMTGAGEHTIVEQSAERLVLRRLGVLGADFDLHRTCGPEIEAARAARKLRQLASKGDYAMIKALIDQGADVNGVDKLESLERTALLAAAQEGHGEVVKLLIARGASVTVLDSGGRSVFDHARKKLYDLLPALTAKLPVASSPELPVFQKMSNDTCPAEYIDNNVFACVHAAALAREGLEAEWQEFNASGKSPKVGAASVAVAAAAPPPIEPQAPKKGATDLSQLDPGALMNPNGDAPPPDTSGSDRAYNPDCPAGYSGNPCLDPWGNPVTQETLEREARHARQEAEAEQRLDPQSKKMLEGLGQMFKGIEQAAHDPKYKGADGKKQFDEDFKKAWCEGSRAAVDDARAGKNGEAAAMLGISKEEHRRKLEEKYRSECE